MTTPIGGPLHQAIDTLAGPASSLAERLHDGSIDDLASWSDAGGRTTGIDDVAADAARWWAPTASSEVSISVLDGVAVDQVAIVETLFLSGSGLTAPPLALCLSVIEESAGQDAIWRQHGDPTAAARSVAVPAFPRPHVDVDDHVAARRQQDVVRDFFALHEDIDGVLEARDRHAHADVLLWHGAEGVRAEGKANLLDFYRAQHGRFAYSGVTCDLHLIASRAGYTAGEITYTLTHDELPTIVLPAAFGVDFDAEDRIVSWRDYSRAWIPEAG